MTVTIYHDTCRWVIDSDCFFQNSTLTAGKKLLAYAFADPMGRNAVVLNAIRDGFQNRIDDLKRKIINFDTGRDQNNHDLQYIKAFKMDRRHQAELNKLKNEHSRQYKLLTFYDEMSKKYSH